MFWSCESTGRGGRASGEPLGRERQDPAPVLCRGATPVPRSVPGRDDHGQGHAAERDGCRAEEPLPGDGLRSRARGCEGLCPWQGTRAILPALPALPPGQGIPKRQCRVSSARHVAGAAARTACAAGCPADSASQRAAGSKVLTLQLAWLGSGGHSQEHRLLSVFSGHGSRSTAPCSQRDRSPDTAHPHPAWEQGCVPPAGPGGTLAIPCGSPIHG